MCLRYERRISSGKALAVFPVGFLIVTLKCTSSVECTPLGSEDNIVTRCILFSWDCWYIWRPGHFVTLAAAACGDTDIVIDRHGER
jgi:hypothetical protein